MQQGQAAADCSCFHCCTVCVVTTRADVWAGQLMLESWWWCPRAKQSLGKQFWETGQIRPRQRLIKELPAVRDTMCQAMCTRERRLSRVEEPAGLLLLTALNRKVRVHQADHRRNPDDRHSTCSHSVSETSRHLYHQKLTVLRRSIHSVLPDPVLAASTSQDEHHQKLTRSIRRLLPDPVFAMLLRASTIQSQSKKRCRDGCRHLFWNRKLIKMIKVTSRRMNILYYMSYLIIFDAWQRLL